MSSPRQLLQSLIQFVNENSSCSTITYEIEIHSLLTFIFILVAGDEKVRTSQIQKINEYIDVATKQFLTNNENVSTSYGDFNYFFVLFISIVDQLLGESVTLAAVTKSNTEKPKVSVSSFAAQTSQPTKILDRSEIKNDLTADKNMSYSNLSITSTSSKNSPVFGDWLRQLVSSSPQQRAR